MDHLSQHREYEQYSVIEFADQILIRTKIKMFAIFVGFNDIESHEISLAADELASNLLKHAGGGQIKFSRITDLNRTGISIETLDTGPGFSSVTQAMKDGFSTVGTLGSGLGTVNRLMDEVIIKSNPYSARGSQIISKKWIRKGAKNWGENPFDVATASRPHPHMMQNGDSFVIKKWDTFLLTAVIDGLGHGQFAYKAAMKAREYIESHYDQPLMSLFRGVGINCKATRGVVMAIALFDWERATLCYGSVGNIEMRVFGPKKPIRTMIRRGIVGIQAPNPAITEHPWKDHYMAVMFSDGITSHWTHEEFPIFAIGTALEIAQDILRKKAKENDDATVLVVKKRKQ